MRKYCPLHTLNYLYIYPKTVKFTEISHGYWSKEKEKKSREGKGSGAGVGRDAGIEEIQALPIHN